MRLSRRTGRLILLAALAAVAAGLVTLRRVNPAAEAPGTGLVLSAVSPAIRAIGWLDRTVTAALADVLGLVTARRAVERLEAENAELRLELALLNEAMRRVGRWPALVAAAEALALPTVAADVLSRGGDASNPTYLINAGVDDGVSAGCPVLAPQGLVGRVMLATAHASTVRLITAENLAVSATLLPGGHRGMLRGLGAGGRLEFLPEDQGAEIQVGQSLITAGDEGSHFPPGLPIGTVVEIGTTDRGLRRCLVAPSADLRRLSDMLVIIGEMPRLHPLEGHRLIAGAMASAEARAEAVSPESLATLTSIEVIAVAVSSEVEDVEASLEAESVASPEAAE